MRTLCRVIEVARSFLGKVLLADRFLRYHVVTAGVHRLLQTQGPNAQDLWRRSGFPFMVARHPTERPEVYGRCLTALTAELQRLRLPHVSLIGTDWAPGLRRVIQASMPRCVWVPDMDHMFRNMAKSNLVEENGETVRVPRLKSRTFESFRNTWTCSPCCQP